MQSVVEYNIALMELHYRAGKLLELDNVHLSEGPWDVEAECDVIDRGYDRWHSIPTATMLHQEPEALVTPGGAPSFGPPMPIVPTTDNFGPAVDGWIEEHPADTVTPPAPPREIEASPTAPPPQLLPPPVEPAGQVHMSFE
jgi:hypothetical protein